MDPLEWTHQWDDYEMMMYVDTEDSDGEGIYMQVSRKYQRDGAEEWDIVYNRKISDLVSIQNPHDQGTLEWEDVILREYLHRHPTLVSDEKAYLAGHLDETNSAEPEG